MNYLVEVFNDGYPRDRYHAASLREAKSYKYHWLDWRGLKITISVFNDGQTYRDAIIKHEKPAGKANFTRITRG
jgi:hypothetical protein